MTVHQQAWCRERLLYRDLRVEEHQADLLRALTRVRPTTLYRSPKAELDSR